MTNKKTVPKKELASAKAAKKSVLKKSVIVKKKTSSKMASSQKELMESFFNALNEFMSIYSKIEAYTFTEFGKDDKMGKAAKKEVVRLQKATRILCDGMTDEKMKELAELVNTDEKNIRHFIARDF